MMRKGVLEEGYRYFLVIESDEDGRGDNQMSELVEVEEWMVASLNPAKGNTLQLIRIANDAVTADPKLYPNPISKGEFSIYYDHGSNENVLFQVYDLRGRIVWEEDREMAAGQLLHHFNLYGLQKGEYIFKMHTGTSEFTERIVVVD